MHGTQTDKAAYQGMCHGKGPGMCRKKCPEGCVPWGLQRQELVAPVKRVMLEAHLRCLVAHEFLVDLRHFQQRMVHGLLQLPISIVHVDQACLHPFLQQTSVSQHVLHPLLLDKALQQLTVNGLKSICGSNSDQVPCIVKFSHELFHHLLRVVRCDGQYHTMRSQPDRRVSYVGVIGIVTSDNRFHQTGQQPGLCIWRSEQALAQGLPRHHCSQTSRGCAAELQRTLPFPPIGMWQDDGAQQDLQLRGAECDAVAVCTQDESVQDGEQS
mmetsp:Transcript_4103/g.7610  ORF Transcript_4103/g.7610 Transcript_4103/m.7610 type:complete len:269 (+) Transcript_4103:753-1559(+)